MVSLKKQIKQTKTLGKTLTFLRSPEGVVYIAKMNERLKKPCNFVTKA